MVRRCEGKALSALAKIYGLTRVPLEPDFALRRRLLRQIKELHDFSRPLGAPREFAGMALAVWRFLNKWLPVVWIGIWVAAFLYYLASGNAGLPVDLR